MHAHFHQLLRVFCESQRGASRLARPDCAAFSSSHKIFLHTQPPASDFMCIYITYVILSSEPLAGRRRKDCTGAFFFPKGREKKSSTRAQCVDSLRTGKGEEKRNVCGAECPRVPLLATPATARVPPCPPGPRQPRGPLAWAPPRRFREGEIDRARPSAAETHSHTTRDTITLTLPPPSVNFR